MQDVKDYLVQRLKVMKWSLQYLRIFPHLQEVYGDRAHFNGDYPGSQCLPNTCNVSITVPGRIIQGKIIDEIITKLSCISGTSILSKLKRCVASSAAACHSDLDKSADRL